MCRDAEQGTEKSAQQSGEKERPASDPVFPQQRQRLENNRKPGKTDGETDKQQRKHRVPARPDGGGTSGCYFKNAG